MYGRRVSGGYTAWLKAGNFVPSGRILCVDDTRVYGFGRKPQFMANSSVVEYRLFAADASVAPEAIARLEKTEKKVNARSTVSKNASRSDWRLRHFFPAKDLSAVTLGWTVDQPAVLARAMTVTSDTLFVAGPPDVIDERRAFHLPDDPDVQKLLARQAEALEGRHGGELWGLSKADGTVAARYALDTIPVFDGMAAAGTSLYITAVDGSVTCLAAGRGEGLKKIDNRPAHSAWDTPEDPAYVLPPP